MTNAKRLPFTSIVEYVADYHYWARKLETVSKFIPVMCSVPLMRMEYIYIIIKLLYIIS